MTKTSCVGTWLVKEQLRNTDTGRAKDFHLAQMDPKLGVQEGYFTLFQAHLRNYLGQEKFFWNDPKSLTHSGFVIIFLETHRDLKSPKVAA